MATEQDFAAEKIVTDETPVEELVEYSEYTDPKYAEKLMAESMIGADEALSQSPRKGPASETEPEPEPVPAATESGV
jgi:small subunit ribosomal protein S2